MSNDNVTPIPKPRGLVMPELSPEERLRVAAEVAERASWKPRRPQPVTQYRVERNDHYSTPVHVFVDVKAATPEEVLTALSAAYTAVRKQVRTMSDQDAADLGDGL
jgi:hypothetical protein